MATVNDITIDGVTYKIYGTLADATAYLNAATHAAAWAAVEEDTQAKALVTARRMLDRQRWLGTRTGGDSQPTDWPRTGVVDAEGYAVDENTVPEGIEYGEYELALLLLAGATATQVQGQQDSGSNVKAVGAGSARVEFFNPTSGTTSAERFPKVVQELVGEFLAGSVVSLGIAIEGIAESAFASWDLGYTGSGLA